MFTKDFYINIHNNLAYISEKVKITKIFLNRRIDDRVLYIYVLEYYLGIIKKTN